MPNVKDLREHIENIRETQQITNAMYLISSNKLRHMKEELDHTRPYFTALQEEVKRIFQGATQENNRYFYPLDETQKITGTYGYLIITADKGLAGAYNQNVIKEAARLLERHPEREGERLFVLGECGKRYYRAHGIPFETDFPYALQNPTLHTARQIGDRLLEQYNNGELAKIYVVYTDMRNGVGKARFERLLPFHRTQSSSDRKNAADPFLFYPSVGAVLDQVVPSYVAGFIYSALVDSFCSELNARMLAMSEAERSAEKILASLTVQYNHIRQGAITQEISEISAASRGMKRKTARAGENQK